MTADPTPPDPLAPEAQLFDPTVATFLEIKARQLARRPEFGRGARGDLEQDLRAKLLQSLASFNPLHSPWVTFAYGVLERYAATLVRDATAARRDRRATVSLSAARRDMAPLLRTAERARHRGVSRPSEKDLAALAADVATILESLPPELRDLAEQLQVGSQRAAANALGKTRGDLVGMLRRLRAAFAEAGYGPEP
jgi:hypothetical protein